MAWLVTVTTSTRPDGHHVNAAGHRGVHDVADGQDAVALAEQALGDDLVVDLRLIDEHAGDGRVNGVLARCERGGEGVHDVADGQDAVALAEQALGDDLVVDLRLIDEHAGDGRVNGVLARCERGGEVGLGVLGAVEHTGDTGEKAHWLPPSENGAPYVVAHAHIWLSYPISGDCMPAFRPSWRNREICCSESVSGRIPREVQSPFPQVAR